MLCNGILGKARCVCLSSFYHLGSQVVVIRNPFDLFGKFRFVVGRNIATVGAAAFFEATAFGGNDGQSALQSLHYRDAKAFIMRWIDENKCVLVNRWQVVEVDIGKDENLVFKFVLGDIITAVNGKAVKNVSDFYQELSKASKSVNFDIYSNGGTVTTGTYKF